MLKLNYEAGRVPTKHELYVGQMAYNVPDDKFYLKLIDDEIIEARPEYVPPVPTPEPDYTYPATLENNWINYNLGSVPFRYVKTKDGTIHVEFTVKDGTVGSTIFTLPQEYCPNYDLILPARTHDNAVVGRVDILTTGEVVSVEGGNTMIAFQATYRQS